MPTGLTYAISTGEMTSLKEYALTCVRAMGGLAHMRDLPYGANIPRKIEPDISHYEKQIFALKESLKKIEEISYEEFRNKIISRNEEEINKIKDRSTEYKNRYQNMIQKLKIGIATYRI